jgi:DNA repair exonuclease SbcCD ATPase subunit
VAALAAGTVYLIKRMREQTVAQKAINDVTEQAARETRQQKNLVEDLIKTANNEKKTLEERKAALEQRNEISPEYFGHLSLAKSTTEELTKAGEAYIANLEKQALVKAAQAKIDELREANANKEIDIETKKKKWYESTEGAARRANKAIEKNKDAIEALQAIVDKNKPAVISSTTTENNIINTDTDNEKPTGNPDDPIKKLEELHKRRLVELKRQQIEESKSDSWFKTKSMAAELEFLNNKLALQQKYGIDTIDTEDAILNHSLKLREEYEKNIENIDKTLKQLQEEDDNLTFEWEFDKEAGDEALGEAEKYLENYDRLKAKYKTDKQMLAEEFKAELADLDSALEYGLISRENFEKRKNEIVRKYSAKSFETEKAYLDAVGNIANGLSDMFNAAKEAELAKAGDNATKKEAIEKRYAKKQQKIAIGQAFIGGAQAIIELWANKSTIPSPLNEIYKGVMTGIIAGTTALQIAKISNQQFKSGGFTSLASSDSQPAGIVHANEWVASAPLLRDPSTRRHIDYLEQVQRGMVPTFNTRNISASVRGFQSGGYTTTPPLPVPGSSTATDQAAEQNNALMGAMIGLLTDLRNNGIRATAEVNAREVFRKNDEYQNSITASEY